MKDIIIYGSGGLASETVELIEDINRIEPVWNIKGYIDDIRGESRSEVNGYRILGTQRILREMEPPVHIVLALSDPSAKKKSIRRSRTVT